VPVTPPAAPMQTTPPPRRVLFDDVDVPDFLKNGS
jgi:cell division protein FtsZ